jgi:anti-sigma-K factor RskA
MNCMHGQQPERKQQPELREEITCQIAINRDNASGCRRRRCIWVGVWAWRSVACARYLVVALLVVRDPGDVEGEVDLAGAHLEELGMGVVGDRRRSSGGKSGCYRG